MTERSRLLTDWLLLAGFCGFLFFFGLAHFGLVGADEPRYAQIAREMLARHDWITPTLDGKPWLEKPALYYWQAMLAYRIFGVSDWAARLPSAVDAVLMVLAVYFFLRRFRPAFELDGALMTASLAGVIGFARAASMDMPLSATFTIALLAWFAWYESGSKRFLTLFYAFLGLGMLAKGPVAPVLAAIIIVVFVLSIRSTALLARTLWLPGITLFCAVAVPWYVAVQMRNPEFFRVFILEHNLARFRTNLYHHTAPLWYFVPVLLLGLVPWTMFVVAAAMEVARASGGGVVGSGVRANAYCRKCALRHSPHKSTFHCCVAAACSGDDAAVHSVSAPHSMEPLGRSFVCVCCGSGDWDCIDASRASWLTHAAIGYAGSGGVGRCRNSAARRAVAGCDSFGASAGRADNQS